MTQDQFNEAVLNVTGGQDWAIVQQGLANDIYQIQAGALDAKNWDAVCEARGFAAGLAYISALRETTLMAMEQQNADV